MANTSNRNRGYRPQTDSAGGFIGLLGVAAVIGAAAPLVEASIVAALAAAAFAAFATLLVVAASRTRGDVRLPKALLILSALAALSAGPVVFLWRWISFDVLEWIWTGLYVAALAAGLLRALPKLLRLLAALLAPVMVAATIALPVPKGGESDSADNRWSVAVTVEDQDGEKLEDALVQCSVWIEWLGGPPPLATIEPHLTNGEGEAKPWEFQEDRRLKSVLCGAGKLADDGNAGYPLRLGERFAPHPGENALTIVLNENPHPDTAYLTVKLAADPPYAWSYLDFELWDRRPPAEFDVHGGYEVPPVAAKNWAEWKSHAFAVGAETAGKELFLRYRYERPSAGGSGPPAVTVAAMRVGALDLGTRRSLTVELPKDTEAE